MIGDQLGHDLKTKRLIFLPFQPVMKSWHLQVTATLSTRTRKAKTRDFGEIFLWSNEQNQFQDVDDNSS